MKNILSLLYDFFISIFQFFISIFQMFSFNKRNNTAKKLLSGFENTKTTSSLKKISL
jgi:hypothetical protein